MLYEKSWPFGHSDERGIVVKGEISTRTGARIEVLQHRPMAVADETTGAVDTDFTFLLRLSMVDSQDTRSSEVLLTRMELEQLGAVIDMLKYVY